MQSTCETVTDIFPLPSLSELLHFEVDFHDSLAELVCDSLNSDDMYDDFITDDGEAENLVTQEICCHRLWPQLVEAYFKCRLVTCQRESCDAIRSLDRC